MRQLPMLDINLYAKDSDWNFSKPETFEYNGKWVKNWFSNMVPSEFTAPFPMTPDNSATLKWPSVENYYQAAKTHNFSFSLQILRSSPSQAKQLGRKAELRSDWENIKDQVMYKALWYKFVTNPDTTWKEKLLKTKDEILVEWNNWGDTYWGADIKTGKGKNTLGVMLMRIRYYLWTLESLDQYTKV